MRILLNIFIKYMSVLYSLYKLTKTSTTCFVEPTILRLVVYEVLQLLIGQLNFLVDTCLLE